MRSFGGSRRRPRPRCPGRRPRSPCARSAARALPQQRLDESAERDAEARVQGRARRRRPRSRGCERDRRRKRRRQVRQRRSRICPAGEGRGAGPTEEAPAARRRGTRRWRWKCKRDNGNESNSSSSPGCRRGFVPAAAGPTRRRGGHRRRGRVRRAFSGDRGGGEGRGALRGGEGEEERTWSWRRKQQSRCFGEAPPGDAPEGPPPFPSQENCSSFSDQRQARVARLKIELKIQQKQNFTERVFYFFLPKIPRLLFFDFESFDLKKRIESNYRKTNSSSFHGHKSKSRGKGSKKAFSESVI